MTPGEFAAAMEEIDLRLGGDVEAAHWEADRLLCTLLRQLGYDEGVDAFEAMSKWYA